MKRVSIKDIAKQAGVVPSTVSFVLNGKAREMRISEELADKIKKLAIKNNYRPNHTAVSLRTGRSGTIGLIVEDISNVFFATLAKTIEDEAYAMGYKVVYCSTENNPAKAVELIRMLSHQQVEGFVITPCDGMEEEVKRLMHHKTPVVMLDRYLNGFDTPYVLLNNREGVQEAMQHLVDRGYKNIAFVTVDLDQVQMQEREAAYDASIRNNELTPCVLKLPYHPANPEDSVAQISGFLSAHRELDAVFFATNYLGVYGLQSIQSLGLSMPGDIAVVCFDDHDIFRLVTPAITIVRQPVHDMGATALRLLIKQLAGKISLSPETQHVLTKAQLVIRGST